MLNIPAAMQQEMIYKAKISNKNVKLRFSWKT
jgi:hypothetical protein